MRGRDAVFTLNEALNIVILLNKSQDRELKLFPVYFNVNFSLIGEYETASGI